ncbi:sugar ABC transporter permease [Egibacter rhizosphaerae]|uniref:Sugar ABC transporter permease n=2 Tax=Egibacter rhizosphaerae TaxID=1670831 RepID=A0A411YLI4_9ACTN|nr:sugar ABC transporter permease [Egibacter rhizosphaerae]
MGVFLIFPALWTLYLGLTDVRLTGVAAADPQFVGIENYLTALSDSLFYNALIVTLLFVLGSAVIGQTVLGFLLAWALRGWQSPVRRGLEVLVILAWIMPDSVVAFLWIAYLDGDSGTLNQLLPFVGETEWLLEHALPAIIVFNVWRGTAFAMLLFGAALNAVPPSHLETARLAGASAVQQLRDVVLPTIRGHILTALLLVSLWTFNLFTPYLLTQGGPNFETEVLPIYVFREAFSHGRLGYGAAISAIMILINLVIALFYIHVLRERTS